MRISKFIAVAILLCGAVFAQDAAQISAQLETLQDHWQMEELAQRMTTDRLMQNTPDDMTRAAIAADGQQWLATIRKRYRARTQDLVNRGVAIRHRSLRVLRDANREDAIYIKLQSPDYGWQEVSFLAKSLKSK